MDYQDELIFDNLSLKIKKMISDIKEYQNPNNDNNFPFSSNFTISPIYSVEYSMSKSRLREISESFPIFGEPVISEILGRLKEAITSEKISEIFNDFVEMNEDEFISDRKYLDSEHPLKDAYSSIKFKFDDNHNFIFKFISDFDIPTLESFLEQIVQFEAKPLFLSSKKRSILDTYKRYKYQFDILKKIIEDVQTEKYIIEQKIYQDHFDSMISNQFEEIVETFVNEKNENPQKFFDEHIKNK